MRAVPAPIGATAVDCWVPLSPVDIEGLRFAHYPIVIRYVDNITATELANITNAGLLVYFVVSCYGNGFAPTEAAAQNKHNPANAKLVSLGIPATTSVFVDFEGPGGLAVDQLKYCEAAAACLVGKFTAGLYLGFGVACTGHELYSLPSVTRYYKGGSRLVDRYGAVIEPECGFAAYQSCKFNQTIGNHSFDLDWLPGDYRGRTVICCGA